MVGKVLDIENVLMPDQIAWQIVRQFQTWEMFRNAKVAEWNEVQKYVFATDTTKTTNNQLPWSNKTTIPKLCQIRDNLYANYMASMFPKKKNYIWQGDSESDDEMDKVEAIESYIDWATDRNEYYNEAGKLALDYIDYGNAFATVEWEDRRAEDDVGYVGPVIRRISPLDIVFNPTAPSFTQSPKIIRSIVGLGEVKELLLRDSVEEGDREAAENLFEYLKNFREMARDHVGTVHAKNEIYNVAGFGSFYDYLVSGYVEILTFYGDMYVE